MFFKRHEALCKITIDGKNVTNKFDPYLISITVTDFDGSIDTCDIDLDDSYGILALPADNTSVTVELGWKGDAMMVTFQGRVTDVVSSFQRKQGRILRIEAKGADMYGLGKQPMRQEWGEGEPPEGKTAKKIKLETVLTDAAQAAGYTIKISPELGRLERDYWAQQNESFYALGQRLAGEVGGVFKVADKVASMTSASNNMNVAGKAMPDVRARWGANLIAWRISPKVGRPSFAKTLATWFDPAKAIWRTVEKALGGTGAATASKAIHLGILPVATEDQANQQAQADAALSGRKIGFGWVIIDGEPRAAAGSNCIVEKARAGVDGSYRITEAEHTYFRRGGFQTRLQLEQPGPTVGKDFRGDFER